MRHVVIGDLHGRAIWKQALITGNTKVVFLGDYVDSFHFSNEQIKNNLLEIINYKLQNPDLVVLLIGNHDAQYLNYPHHRCQGFRPEAQAELTAIFNQHRTCFQFAYQSRNYLFTHAGVTNRWFAQLKRHWMYSHYRKEKDSLADIFNRIDYATHESLLYSTCRYRTSEDSDGGPLWADAYATFHDALNGYHQIVGHTPRNQIQTYTWRGKSITYADVLHMGSHFYIIHC